MVWKSISIFRNFSYYFGTELHHTLKISILPPLRTNPFSVSCILGHSPRAQLTHAGRYNTSTAMTRHCLFPQQLWILGSLPLFSGVCQGTDCKQKKKKPHCNFLSTEEKQMPRRAQRTLVLSEVGRVNTTCYRVWRQLPSIILQRHKAWTAILLVKNLTAILHR